MISHVRTLLLNRDGSKRPGVDYFLEEFVDPGYRPINLPHELQVAHRILFPSRYDDAFANFRLRQCMQVLHSNEHAHYVTDLDPRVTYLRPRTAYNRQTQVFPTVLTAGAAGVDLVLLGDAADRRSPRLLREWTIEVTGGSLVQMIADNGRSDVIAVNAQNGMSDIFPLVDHPSLQLRIAASPLPVGAKWLLEGFTAPVDDISELPERLAKIGDAALEFIFRGGEPFKTFKALWEQNTLLTYRLTGFLLAWAYRADQFRHT